MGASSIWTTRETDSPSGTSSSSGARTPSSPSWFALISATGSLTFPHLGQIGVDSIILANREDEMGAIRNAVIHGLASAVAGAGHARAPREGPSPSDRLPTHSHRACRPLIQGKGPRLPSLSTGGDTEPSAPPSGITLRQSLLDLGKALSGHAVARLLRSDGGECRLRGRLFECCCAHANPQAVLGMVSRRLREGRRPLADDGSLSRTWPGAAVDAAPALEPARSTQLCNHRSVSLSLVWRVSLGAPWTRILGGGTTP